MHPSRQARSPVFDGDQIGLRVGIDGRSFDAPAAGIRRYVHGLTRALLALQDAPELVALGGNPLSAPPGVVHVEEPRHPPSNLGWMLVGLPRAARRAKLDVIHAPAYTAPFWSPYPVVLTIHDVSYELHPEWYPYRRDAIRRAFYRFSAHRAAAIIAVSAFSASEIHVAYGIGPDRVTVVPLGVDQSFRQTPLGLPPGLPASVRSPFVLHVGDLHERRNLPMLVDAVIAARRRTGLAAALSLVLAGIDRGVGEELCTLASRAGVPEAVTLLGPVEEPLLRELYRGAVALVYPSLYEGFGLPLLEAMKAGVPVIASDAASIPEVVGDAGVLLHPQDGAQWTDAMVRVMNDERWREDLQARGRARAAMFTWEATARRTLDVYRRVAGLRRDFGGHARA